MAPRIPLARPLCRLARSLQTSSRAEHVVKRVVKAKVPAAKSWGAVPRARRLPVAPPLPKVLKARTVERLSESEVPEFVQEHASVWTSLTRVQTRLKNHGVGDKEKLCRLFAEDASAGKLSTANCDLSRFTAEYDGSRDDHLDGAFTLAFYSWACHPANRGSLLARRVQEKTLERMGRLFSACDLTQIEQDYPLARSMTRKVIMHVGPTNSGKTHQALAALAAAPSGIFAGPLRLLAAEIWERLNKGQIVPLGQSLPPSTDTALRDFNPMFARDCNLFTGEEQKIVSTTATLSSATVEMVPTTRMYDVAIVDEIQMIADEARGGAWTNAVLGLAARELHLCGEETAVPIVAELMRLTGDELIVNRYERLTPLVPEKESLKGDYSKIRAGDCVIAFSRKQIYSHKRQIELLTKHKCAVAYGRLPPEIRSEQAALFNDPNSGYDVMVGSDAIGMGLNLKIKRTILTSMNKFNGQEMAPISTSQAKQIAGRAGRYGLHTDDSGGTTTTLHDFGHVELLEALKSTVPPLTCARISPPLSVFEAVAQALPSNSPMISILEAIILLTRASGSCRLPDYTVQRKTCVEIDQNARNITLSDRVQMLSAPVPWGDEEALPCIVRMMRLYSKFSCVRVREMLVDTVYLKHLGEMEARMQGKEEYEIGEMNNWMSSLESFHKVLEVYGWFAFRNVVAYPDAEECRLVLERVERGMDYALEAMISKKVADDQLMKSWKFSGPKKKAFAWLSRSEYMRSTEGTAARRVTA